MTDLPNLLCPHFRKQKNLPNHKLKGLKERENKIFKQYGNNNLQQPTDNSRAD